MRLSHPNIIRVYQIFDSEEDCLIVMDYAAGGEMVQKVARENKLTEEQGRKYFRQLVSVLLILMAHDQLTGYRSFSPCQCCSP